jgi:molybdate transport system substrate-binding protein
MKIRRHSVIVAFLLVTLMSYAANAAEIKVLASGATKEACLDLIPAFERSSGHKVVATWAGTVDIKKHMAAGDVYDVVIVAAPEVEAFTAQGKIVEGSRVDLMKSSVGVAVRAGAQKPDIGSTEALKKTLLAAKSIGYSTGPSGVYMGSLFERMGIADLIKPKLKQVPPGERIGSVIARGDAEIGFQQVSELIHEPGIDYLGPLPADVNKVTVFSAGIHSRSHDAAAAKSFIEYLTSSAAVPAIKHHGMDPG